MEEEKTMEKNYEVCGRTLKTKAFETSFEHNVETVIWHDDVLVVLLSPTDENGSVMKNLMNNVYGVNSQGKILWQIDPAKMPHELWPYVDNETNNALFTGISLCPSGVEATTFFSMRYTLDHKTGRILKKESVGW